MIAGSVRTTANRALFVSGNRCFAHSENVNRSQTKVRDRRLTTNPYQFITSCVKFLLEKSTQLSFRSAGVQSHKPTKHILKMSSSSKPCTIVVEGNIGSGKTTFLNHFKKFPIVSVLDEPISKWRDLKGHNLLDLVYKDPHKWSLCFQSYVQLTMLDLHCQPVKKPVKMMERSLFSAKYCFVENLKNAGLMADAEYTVLTEWFDFINDNMSIDVDLIVYMKTDPKVAFQRIAQRGRSEENGITLEYLQSIHDLHEDWLCKNKYKLPAPVLTIDANTELSQMAPHYDLCEKTIFQNVAVAN